MFCKIKQVKNINNIIIQLYHFITWVTIYNEGFPSFSLSCSHSSTVFPAAVAQKKRLPTLVCPNSFFLGCPHSLHVYPFLLVLGHGSPCSLAKTSAAFLLLHRVVLLKDVPGATPGAGRAAVGGEERVAAGGAERVAGGGAERAAADGAEWVAGGGAERAAADGAERVAGGGAERAAAGGAERVSGGGAERVAGGGAERAAADGAEWVAGGGAERAAADGEEWVAGGGAERAAADGAEWVAGGGAERAAADGAEWVAGGGAERAAAAAGSVGAGWGVRCPRRMAWPDMSGFTMKGKGGSPVPGSAGTNVFCLATGSGVWDTMLIWGKGTLRASTFASSFFL